MNGQPLWPMPWPFLEPSRACWTPTVCGGEAWAPPGASAERLQLPHSLVPACRSGLPNFLAVALALGELGYRAVGVRLDSGDLLRQAQEIRGLFKSTAAQ